MIPNGSEGVKRFEEIKWFEFRSRRRTGRQVEEHTNSTKVSDNEKRQGSNMWKVLVVDRQRIQSTGSKHTHKFMQIKKGRF